MNPDNFRAWHLFDMLQFQVIRRFIFPSATVKHDRFIFASVNNQSYHHTDLVYQTCFKKASIDISPADNNQPFYSELFVQDFYSPMQIDTVFPSGNPGYT